MADDRPNTLHTNPSEYQYLLDHAYMGALFATTVFDLLLDDTQYSHHRGDLKQLRDVESTLHHQLASLFTDRAAAPLMDTDTRAEDYARSIGRLGWGEIITATISFGNASLCRLHQLRALAPQPDRPLYSTLIRLEGELIALAEDATDHRRNTRQFSLLPGIRRHERLNMTHDLDQLQKAGA
ncbi:hypothetical protein [Rhodococcus sp. T7]|uniref:hypothetical protein n=1 Tax=Rhodococcus sp. T7 TaxID=627444 RepID=UPI00135B24F1|nr:hypothetical protein [Rhodococcus sp. T7]KAF0956914.1 hypothetical protein MLGJGCBP_09994 [Rhodococcus sp. T7]KAF0958682.1 hypothetical protein MLGJGCBP_08254 [Rhodococcus sp. T7]